MRATVLLDVAQTFFGMPTKFVSSFPLLFSSCIVLKAHAPEVRPKNVVVNVPLTAELASINTNFNAFSFFLGNPSASFQTSTRT
jgi:hypothetical protein